MDGTEKVAFLSYRYVPYVFVFVHDINSWFNSSKYRHHILVGLRTKNFSEMFQINNSFMVSQNAS
jgi:hypothetical protein